jgi:hypothetical protein
MLYIVAFHRILMYIQVMYTLSLILIDFKIMVCLVQLSKSDLL